MYIQVPWDAMEEKHHRQNRQHSSAMNLTPLPYLCRQPHNTLFLLPDFVRSAINDIVADRSCRSMLRPILNEAIVNDDCAIS